MAKIVSKSKFKPAALEYFRHVQETQEEIIISDRGKPVLKVIPYREPPKNALDPIKKLRGTLLRYDSPFEPVALEDWGALK